MTESINVGVINKKSKKYIYKKEREELLEKMLNILSINETNKIFHCYEIEQSGKKEEIINLIDDIKRYFRASSWLSLKDTSDNVEKNNRYISIIRSVLKDMDIVYTRSSCKIKIENVFINTSRYHIQ